MSLIKLVFDKVRNDKDTAFLILLYLLTFFGLAIKNIKSVQKKRWLGSCVGMTVVFLIMGRDTWHYLCSVLFCASIIKMTGKRRCHVAATLFMFIYLTTYRIIEKYSAQSYNNPYRRFISITHMMLFMKMVGVAFEIHNSHTNKAKNKECNGSEVSDEIEMIDPTFVEILHYTFSFLGITTGPPIRYRTYDDYLHLPFARAVGIGFTCKQMFFCLVYAIIYLMIESTWPADYVISQEFSDRSMLYRAMYIFIVFESFLFWIFSGFCIAEAMTSSVGLGAYPVEGENKPAHGPTKNYTELIHKTYEEANTATYDFKTLNSVDIMAVHFSLWFPETFRAYNKNVQYFMGMYLYKILPGTWNKTIRIFVLFLMNALWHGVDMSYFMVCLTPVYMPAEAVFKEQYEKMEGWKAKVWAFFNWMVRTYITGFCMLMNMLIDDQKVKACLAALRYSPFLLIISLHLLAWILKTYSNNSRKNMAHYQLDKTKANADRNDFQSVNDKNRSYLFKECSARNT